MKKPHIHAEAIKAWADGAEIECRQISGGHWLTVHDPAWRKVFEYRIKPEPKSDVVDYVRLKLTFDGETGEIKAAEVIA